MARHMKHVLLSSPILLIGFGIFLGYGLAYVFRTEDKLPRCLSLKPTQRYVTDESVNTQKTYFNERLEGKGVIAKVRLGIGNQLYHYACMYALAQDLQRPLYNFVPTRNPSPDRRFLPSERDFALDKFQIPLDNLIDSSTIINDSSMAFVNDSQLLFRTYPTNSPFLMLHKDSYCQSDALWFQYKDEILSMFQLRPEVIQKFPPYVIKLGEEIENSENSVAVHVRRGDFTNRDAWVVPISYQRRSMIRISKMIQDRKGSYSAPKFFIFSDDIEYCREEFQELGEVYQLVFVSSFQENNNNRTTSLQDFYLMNKSRHFIIPNSTFSWWAAYIAYMIRGGNDSIVIASENKPGYWKQGGNLDRDKEQLSFYKDVLHAHVYFPKGWIIYYPSRWSFIPRIHREGNIS